MVRTLGPAHYRGSTDVLPRAGVYPERQGDMDTHIGHPDHVSIVI